MKKFLVLVTIILISSCSLGGKADVNLDIGDDVITSTGNEAEELNSSGSLDLSGSGQSFENTSTGTIDENNELNNGNGSGQVSSSEDSTDVDNQEPSQEDLEFQMELEAEIEDLFKDILGEDGE